MGGAPSHILGESLIQGGADVVNNPDWFKKKEVTHVVSICDMSPRHELKGKIHIDEDDVMTTDLFQYFEQTTNFIHKARSDGGRVYVHCAAGISRSSTITLAYMMTWLEMDFETAYKELALARNGVSPNAGFREQLYKWERSELLHKLREAFRAERAASEHLKKLHELDLACLQQRKDEMRRHMEQRSSGFRLKEENDDEEEEEEEAQTN